MINLLKCRAFNDKFIINISLAIVLGLFSFSLNFIKLDIGFGLNFLFGNALVYAFLRVFSATGIVVAVSIASLHAIVLWSYPWAWAIWTLEAAIVARYARRLSPVLVDVIFWIALGVPLLAFSYGLLIGMDNHSLLLTIAKHATNGVFNVVAGELLYFLFLLIKPTKIWPLMPKMPLGSLIPMVMLAIILVPFFALLYLELPRNNASAQENKSQALQADLDATELMLGPWAESRSAMLVAHAENAVGVGIPLDRASEDALAADFCGIGVITRNDAAVWSGSATRCATLEAAEFLAASIDDQLSGYRIVSMQPQSSISGARLALLVPFRKNGTEGLIVAAFRQVLMEDLFARSSHGGSSDLFIVDPTIGYIPLVSANPVTTAELANQIATSGAVSGIVQIIRDEDRTSPMIIAISEDWAVQSQQVASLPGGKLFAASRLTPEIHDIWHSQLRLFAMLCSTISLVSLLAAWLNCWVGRSFRQLTRSAATLAVHGANSGKIDSLVVKEFDEIAVTIGSAGARAARQSGTLGTYQRRLENITKHAPLVIYAVNITDGKPLGSSYVSETIEAMLGFEPADVSAPGWWAKAVHPDDYDHYAAAFDRLQPGTIMHSEYRVRHKLGHYIWVYDKLSIELAVNHGILEGVGVLIDITERKTATNQLIQAEKLASLGRILTGTAHELNQPLNLIKLAASNLTERITLGQLDRSRILAKLDTILAQVSRASDIMRHMRVFGRMPKEVAQPIDIATSMRSVLSMISPQFALDGTEVVFSACQEGVKVRAHPILLEQVFMNILLNANDAILERRRTEDNPGGLIKISVEQEESNVIITVEDNGCGIKGECMTHAFDPFYTTKSLSEGTGLGLSISYEIIYNIGGEIHFENTLSGAKIIVKIPYIQQVLAR